MKLTITLAVCLLVGGVVFAQHPGADPGHPNAVISIDGNLPLPGSSDAVVGLSGGVSIDILGALPGEDVIFLSGELDVGGFPVPWGGTVDMAAVVVVADGFGGSTGTIIDQFATVPFNISFSLGMWSGSNSCLGTVQAVNTDPTNVPGLRNTAAQRLCQGTRETVYRMGDDDYVLHVLSATTIWFTGGPYSQVYIGSNGVISFGAGDSDFTESMGEFFAGFQAGPTPSGNANPGVALCYSDLNRLGYDSGATYYVKETSPRGAVIEYRDQVHWSSQEPAGTFSATFQNNSHSDVRLDYSGFIPATASTDDIIIGVTDGDDQDGGTDTDLSDGAGTGIAHAIGAFTPAGGTESIGELIPANTAIGMTTVFFFDIGSWGGGNWNIVP